MWFHYRAKYAHAHVPSAVLGLIGLPDPFLPFTPPPFYILAHARKGSGAETRLDSGERATVEKVERTSHTTVSFACENDYKSDFHFAAFHALSVQLPPCHQIEFRVAIRRSLAHR